MSNTTSCLNRCDHHDKHTCKCDAECKVYGDCCADFQTHCQIDFEDNLSLHDTVDEKNLSVCTPVYHNYNVEVGYMYTKCPATWTEPILRSRCSDHSINMHVYDIDGNNYRNIYCALCHNRTIANVWFWDVDDSSDNVYRCPTDVPIIRDMIKKNTLPIRGERFRRCFGSTYCDETFSNLTIINACSLYVHPVSQCANRGPFYRNYHCALCRNIQVPRVAIDCASGGFLGQNMWNFHESEKIIVSSNSRCSLGEFKDPVFKTCRPITCATGYSLLADKCILNNNTADFVSYLECNEQLTLIIFRGHHTDLTCVNEKLERYTEGYNYEARVFKHQASYGSYGDDMWIAYKLSNKSATKMLRNIRKAKMQILKDLLNNCNLTETEIITVCSNKTDECSGQWISGSPSDFRRIIEVENTTDLYLKDTIYFQANTIIYILDYYLQNREHKSYEGMLFCAHIVNSIFLDCAMITLSRNEYYFNQSTLFYGDVKLEADKYTILPNGNAHICRSAIDNQFTDSITLSKLERFRFVSGALDAIHFSFSCLSVISFIGTLVTYMKFKQLRNLQGIGIMCLSFALLFANIFTVLSDKITLSDSVCIAFAAITHYFWLAAFTWMTLISTIMIDTFVFNPAKPLRKSTAEFFLLLLAGWGTPFLIILLLLFLHFCESCFTSDITIYDGDSTCWLATPMINLYAFGIPVVLSLTINLILITITLLSLHTARLASNRLQQKRQNKDAWKEALMLLKVSCKL